MKYTYQFICPVAYQGWLPRTNGPGWAKAPDSDIPPAQRDRVDTGLRKAIEDMGFDEFVHAYLSEALPFVNSAMIGVFNINQVGITVSTLRTLSMREQEKLHEELVSQLRSGWGHLLENYYLAPHGTGARTRAYTAGFDTAEMALPRLVNKTQSTPGPQLLQKFATELREHFGTLDEVERQFGHNILKDIIDLQLHLSGAAWSAAPAGARMAPRQMPGFASMINALPGANDYLDFVAPLNQQVVRLKP